MFISYVCIYFYLIKFVMFFLFILLLPDFSYRIYPGE